MGGWGGICCFHWLRTAQGELSWLWHRSSGAIWLILLRLWETSRGHKPPKQGSAVSAASSLPPRPRVFLMQAMARPLLVPPWSLCLPLSHPVSSYLSHLWPRPLFCLCLTAHCDPSELQVRLTGPHGRRQLMALSRLIAWTLWKGEILSLSNTCHIPTNVKNKGNINGMFSSKRKFWQKSALAAYSLLSWVSFVCLYYRSPRHPIRMSADYNCSSNNHFAALL